MLGLDFCQLCMGILLLMFVWMETPQSQIFPNMRSRKFSKTLQQAEFFSLDTGLSQKYPRHASSSQQAPMSPRQPCASSREGWLHTAGCRLGKLCLAVRHQAFFYKSFWCEAPASANNCLLSFWKWLLLQRSCEDPWELVRAVLCRQSLPLLWQQGGETAECLKSLEYIYEAPALDEKAGVLHPEKWW